MIYQNNSFSRVKENEAKMGAYYTDLSHCRDIRKMFQFPTEEVSVLEPSIGDGQAVIEVTDAIHNPKIKIFGVELNDSVASQTATNPYIAEVLHADFTNGIIVRKNCFSFCFANPPYLADRTDSGSGERLERLFLERICNYLKVGGILVWVVPYSQFLEPQHIRLWMRNFETLCIYRFRDGEYQKYKQIVAVGRKATKSEVLRAQIDAFLTQYHLTQIPILPDNLEATIPVYPSPAEKVDLFTTRLFDHQKAFEHLDSQGLSPDVKKALDQRISVKEFSELNLLRPPIPPKKDSLYLLATSGSGQGLTGSEESLDLHLQRGVAEIVEDSYISDEGDEAMDKAGKLVVTTRTAITMTIVENDGTINVLT